jgi:hypothetical protein
VKVEFLKEYTARTATGETRTVAAGTVLDLSPDKGNRLVDAVVVLDLDAVVSIWREFAASADKVYRSYSTTSDSWIQHKNHLHVAQALFKTARIPEARAELDKALAALRAAPMM